jgi:hypothetical protein
MVSVDDGRTSSADATETPNGAEQGQGGMQTVVEEVVPAEVDGESLEQGVVTTIDTDNKGGDSVEAVKVDATPQPPLLSTSLDRPSSVDGTSTHSLPYVSVTEPQSPLPPTSPTRIENSSSVSVLPTPTSAGGVPPPSPIRSNMPTSPSSRRSLDRPQRRSTIDVGACFYPPGRMFRYCGRMLTTLIIVPLAEPFLRLLQWPRQPPDQYPTTQFPT